ncbi:hypothetical protein PFISCL1PPCAC_27151, partial [Pristionchus fissidentatus]
FEQGPTDLLCFCIFCFVSWIKIAMFHRMDRPPLRRSKRTAKRPASSQNHYEQRESSSAHPALVPQDEEDRFSSLPDDILTEIFTQIDRRTLREMEGVSKRMRQFYFSELPKKYRRSAELRMVQRNDRQAFTIFRKENSDYNIFYLLDLSKIHVDQLLADRVMRMKETKYIFKFDVRRQHKDLIDKEAAKLELSHIPFTQQYYEALRHILSTNSFEMLRLVNMIIDPYFFVEAPILFAGVSDILIKMEGISTLEMEKEHYKRFIDWILSLTPHALHVDDSIFVKQNLATLDFLLKFAQLHNEVSFTIRKDTMADDKIFDFPRSKFPQLCKYKELNHAGISVKISLLLELFNMKMRGSPCEGRWRFCVTDCFFIDKVSDYQLNSCSIEEWEDWDGFVLRRMDSMNFTV